MPILSIEGMADVILPTASITNASGVAMAGSPYKVFGNTTYSAVTVTKEGQALRFDTVMGSGGANLSRMGAISRTLSDIVTFTANTFLYGGVRIKPNRAMLSGQSVVCIHDIRAGSLPNAAANVQVLLSSDSPGVAKDKEVYFEWAIDMVNRKFLRRLDGVRLADIGFASSTWDTVFLNQGAAVAYGQTYAVATSQTEPVSFSIKDIYIGEKVAGETIDWLGPQIVTPISIDQVTAPWVASDGTDAKTVFNKAMAVAADLATPYVTSDLAATEAQIKLSVPNVGTINAIQLNTVAKRQVGLFCNLRAKMTTGGVDSSVSTTDLTSGSALRPSFVSMKAPGNLTWTPALLAASTFKLVAVNI